MKITVESVVINNSEHGYEYKLSDNKQVVYMTSVGSEYTHAKAMRETDTVTYTVNYSNGMSITKTVNARLLTVGEALQLTQDERRYDGYYWWLTDYFGYDFSDNNNYSWSVSYYGVLYEHNNLDTCCIRLGFTI